MTESRAALSIIIVSWNTRELLAQCLESIADARAEIFVVDNASTDGSAAMVRERFPDVWLIENQENVGFARANNQAIRQSTGAHVLLLNSDTKVHAGALETLLAFMERHPEVGAAGARLLNTDGSVQPSCHPMLTPEREFWRLLFLESLWARATYPTRFWSDTASPRQVEVIKGACLLVRREALNMVGLLDDSYFMYSEEVDLCYRLSRAGWQLWWVPQAEITHYGEASSRQAAQAMYLQLYRSKILFYRKHGGERRANRFKWYLRLAYGPRLALALLAPPFMSSLSVHAGTWRKLLAELPAM